MVIPFSHPLCLGDARLARNARPLAVGTLRPAIVLYDEAHPLGEEIGAICSADISKKPDMVVIMGTSLKVHGLKNLVRGFANAVRGMGEKPKGADASLPPKTRPGNLLASKNPKLVIFINRTPPPADLAHLIDYWVEGDTDAWVKKCEADWRMARPQDWEVQSKLVGADGESRGMPLSETKNTFQVVKRPSMGAAIAKEKGSIHVTFIFLRLTNCILLAMPHSTKSPGSENALPSSKTLSIIIPATVSKVPPLPKIRLSLRPAVNPASIPIPPSPKIPNSSLPERLLHVGSVSGAMAQTSDVVDTAPVTVGPSPPSPKKKRLADGRAKPMTPSESEKEPSACATLFGTRVKGECMSLDAIVIHGQPPSQAGTSAGTKNKNKPQHVASSRRKAVHDMSIDDIRIVEISSDDEPSSSQATLASEHTTGTTATRRKDAAMSSSQATVVKPPRQRSRAASTGTKKPLPGGVGKSRKARPLSKNTKPLSSSGATTVFDALAIGA